MFSQAGKEFAVQSRKRAVRAKMQPRGGSSQPGLQQGTEVKAVECHGRGQRGLAKLGAALQGAFSRVLLMRAMWAGQNLSQAES